MSFYRVDISIIIFRVLPCSYHPMPIVRSDGSVLLLRFDLIRSDIPYCFPINFFQGSQRRNSGWNFRLGF